MNKRLEIKNENVEMKARRCFKLVNGKPIGFNKEDMINLNKFIEVCAKIYRLNNDKKKKWFSPLIFLRFQIFFQL